MKRFGAVIALSLLLSACAGGGGEGRDEGKPNPRPGPGPAPVLAWGELACQRNRTCGDVALNQDLMALHLFFAKDFAARVERSKGEEYSIYLCSALLGYHWYQTFRQEGDAALADFLLHVMDPVQCSPRGDLNQLLQTYFENTGEYKNEIRKLGSRGN